MSKTTKTPTTIQNAFPILSFLRFWGGYDGNEQLLKPHILSRKLSWMVQKGSKTPRLLEE